MKLNKSNIKGYYQREEIAEDYMARRFSGTGGDFVNSTELSSVLNFPKKYFKGKKIVDLATGTGRVALSLVKLEPEQVIALDASPQMLQELEKHKSDNLLLRQGLAENMPLEDDSYDCMISLRLVEHLKEDILVKVLKEAHRVLKPEGVLVFNTVNKVSLESLIIKLAGASSSSVFPISNSKVQKILRKNNFRLTKDQSSFLIPRGVFLHFPKVVIRGIIILEKILINTPLKEFASHKVWYSVKK